MGEKTSQITTGIYVTVGTLILLISIMLFSSGKSFFTSYYYLNVTFDSAQGIAPGSIVTLSGKEVGNVVAVGFSDDSKTSVQLKIESNVKDRITDKTIASLKTQGALGDRYIYLTPGIGGTPLNDGESIQPEPEEDLLDIVITRAKELGVATEVLKELNVLIGNLNKKGNLPTILENVAGASVELKRVLGDDALTTSVRHLSSILKKTDEGKGTLGKLVNDSSLYDSMLRFIGESPRSKLIKPLVRDAIKQDELKGRSP
jgi:phospholipid/cholesterol/gamma-HCH transport system substrate-binding protein